MKTMPNPFVITDGFGKRTDHSNQVFAMQLDRYASWSDSNLRCANATIVCYIFDNGLSMKKYFIEICQPAAWRIVIRGDSIESPHPI
jgi:hypothetical protein